MSNIGTPDYVPPDDHARLKEAVPRAVNALADVMEQLERQRPVVDAAVALAAWRKRYASAYPPPPLVQAVLCAVEAMEKAQKGGSDEVSK